MSKFKCTLVTAMTSADTITIDGYGAVPWWVADGVLQAELGDDTDICFDPHQEVEVDAEGQYEAIDDHGETFRFIARMYRSMTESDLGTPRNNRQ